MNQSAEDVTLNSITADTNVNHSNTNSMVDNMATGLQRVNTTALATGTHADALADRYRDEEVNVQVVTQSDVPTVTQFQTVLEANQASEISGVPSEADDRTSTAGTVTASPTVSRAASESDQPRSKKHKSSEQSINNLCEPNNHNSAFDILDAETDQAFIENVVNNLKVVKAGDIEHEFIQDQQTDDDHYAAEEDDTDICILFKCIKVKGAFYVWSDVKQNVWHSTYYKDFDTTLWDRVNKASRNVIANTLKHKVTLQIEELQRYLKHNPVKAYKERATSYIGDLKLFLNELRKC